MNTFIQQEESKNTLTKYINYLNLVLDKLTKEANHWNYKLNPKTMKTYSKLKVVQNNNPGLSVGLSQVIPLYNNLVYQVIHLERLSFLSEKNLNKDYSTELNKVVGSAKYFKQTLESAVNRWLK